MKPEAHSFVAYVALGANLGDRLRSLIRAAWNMQQIPAVRVDLEGGLSSIYETSPHGVTDAQPPYLNAVLRIFTALPPLSLFAELRKVEESLGRVRSHRGAARLIDFDLLFYDDLILNTPALILPHPRLHERLFVLEPLTEIAADLMHPVLKRRIGDLWHDVRSARGDEQVTLIMPAHHWLEMLRESTAQVRPE